MKSRIFRLFAKRDNNVWIDDLQSLVDDYNSTRHSTINIEPDDVNKENEDKIAWKIRDMKANKKIINEPYENSHLTKKDEKKFNDIIFTRDHVRYLLPKTLFQQKGIDRWSSEVYQVSRIMPGINYFYLTRYYLEDENQKQLPYSYTRNQLKHADEGDHLRRIKEKTLPIIEVGKRKRNVHDYAVLNDSGFRSRT